MGFFHDKSGNPAYVLAEKATSAHLNGEPDWGVNVDMCDLVNSDFNKHGKDCVKALKLKLLKKSDPARQMLALLALEMCMKNCGQSFHLMVIAKDVPHEMARLATSSGTAVEVHEKTLVLIREWAQQIRHPHLQEVYAHVRGKGVRFPPEQGLPGHIPRSGSRQNVSLADGSVSASPQVSAAAAQPLYIPRLTTAEIIGANLDRMDPADAAAIRAAVQEAELEADMMERREARGELPAGSPPSARGAIDFGGDVGVIRRPDGMPLNFGPPPARNGAHGGGTGSPPRGGYASLDEPALGVPVDGRHAADLLRAQRASREEANLHAAAAAPPNTADDDLSSPQAIAKLHSDLVVARETVSSLRTALAKIDVENDPGAVHKPFVKNLAERCKQMRPRVVSLISDTRDEGLLMAALALNDELSDVADRRDAIAAAADADPDMRAALAASLAEEAARLAISGASDSSREGDLVDLFDAPGPSSAPSGSFGSGSQSATLDASLVELLTGTPFQNASSPVAGKGKQPLVDPFAFPPDAVSPNVAGGNPFAGTLAAGGLPTMPPISTPPVNNARDPFASSAAHDPFAVPQVTQQPTGVTHSSNNSSGSNPFASAIHDPFAVPLNAGLSQNANPFAAPSPGGTGFGGVPATPPSSAVRSNPLFNANAEANAGAGASSQSRTLNGHVTAAARVSQSAVNDPFAALAESARSPPRLPGSDPHNPFLK